MASPLEGSGNHGNGRLELPSTLVLFGLLLAVFFGSDRLLVASQRFWDFCEAGLVRGDMHALRAEVHLRGLAERRPLVLMLGSSVVNSDVDVAALTEGLGLPEGSVGKLAIDGSDATEFAMLTPRLVALRPRMAVYFATPWLLWEGSARSEGLRFYDPGAAAGVFGFEDMLGRGSFHASHLLASQHVVLRHRRELRQLLGRAVSAAPSGGGRSAPDGFVERLAAARSAEFSCASVPVRGLGWMARRLASEEVKLVVVSTPTAGRFRRGGLVADRLEACLAGLSAETGFALLPGHTFSRFRSRDFRDRRHMNPPARERFTRELSAALRPLAESL